MSTLLETVTKYTRRKSLYLGWWVEYTLTIWSNLGSFKRNQPHDLEFWSTVVGDRIVALCGSLAWIVFIHSSKPAVDDWKIWMSFLVTMAAGATFHWIIDKWGNSGERSHVAIRWTMAWIWGQALGLFVIALVINALVH